MEVPAMLSFLVSFLVFIIVVAIIIIGFRWLLSVSGVTIPQPLMVILGLILFLVLLLLFVNYMGGLPAMGHLFHN
jgi:hypothetical protein